MLHATEGPVMAQGAVQLGAIVAGRYRVDRVLGQGGMGIVVQAMHLQLQQPVAIKFLRAEFLEKHQIVQRFLREAQAVVRLRSEHVARVIDVGTLETGVPYMVLEYLEGADLSSFRSQLTVGQVVDLTLQACEALAEAHALGIVHRDIKPANLFITRHADGTLLLKVLDFGISKIRTASGQLTAPQVPMGTPAYMSPEQMRSPHDIDHRSDIWSLGIVLYELLQGARVRAGFCPARAALDHLGAVGCEDDAATRWSTLADRHGNGCAGRCRDRARRDAMDRVRTLP